VSVSAKDLGTGKEQSIKITASSGLSKEEIERMVADAKAHAEDDRKRRELVEERNKLDTMVYATEGALKELGDKVAPELKGSVDTALDQAKKALESNEPEAIKTAFEALEKASHKLSEEAYKKAAAAGAATNGASAENGAGAGPSDDVVDADYEEVRDNK
jgi:molecular chaperone DnaK